MATAIGHTIGALRVVIGADTQALERGLKGAQGGLAKLRTMAVPAAAAIAAVGAAATAAAAGFVNMARAEMEVIDAENKLSRSLGGTVTGLRSLKVAAENAGIDGLEGALNRLNRRLGAVEMGGGPAVETVKRLNLNLAELAEMDVDQRLASIADSIRDSGVSAQEAARHLQQLGFEQRGATEMFLQGGDAIRAARQEVIDFGLAVSQVDADRIEAAGDTFDRISRLMAGLKTQLTVELAPVIEAVASLFLDSARAAGGIGPSVRDSVDMAIRSLSFIIDAIDGLVRVFEVAGKGAAVAFASLRVAANSAAGAIITGPNWAVGKLIDTLNLLPGVDIKSPLQTFVDDLKADTAEAQRIVLEGMADIEDALMRPMASTILQQRIAEIRARPITASPTAGAGGRPTAPVDPQAAEAAKKAAEAEAKAAADRAKMLADQLGEIRTFLADRATLETQATMERMRTLTNLADEQVISEAESRQMILEVAAKHYETMSGLRRDFYERQKKEIEENHLLELSSFAEYFQQRIEAAQAHEAALTQMAIDAFRFRMDELAALREEGALTEEEYRAQVQATEAEHQAELTRIAAQGALERRKVSADEAKERQAVLGGMMANLTQLMNSGNQEMFRIGKIAAIANAVLKGREAVVSSYAAGARIGGPPLGAAFAATAAAATAAQIAAVASTSFGGGGSISAPGGGGTRPTDQLPDDPVVPEGGRERTAVTITLQGEVFGRQQVRDLIEQINEATADGAVLRLN